MGCRETSPSQIRHRGDDRTDESPVQGSAPNQSRIQQLYDVVVLFFWSVQILLILEENIRKSGKCYCFKLLLHQGIHHSPRAESELSRSSRSRLSSIDNRAGPNPVRR